MTDRNSTLVDEAVKGRRVSLETPTTLREKKQASRVHREKVFRELRRIVNKATKVKRQTPVSLFNDNEIEIEPLQMGQRVVLRPGVLVPVKGLTILHTMYRTASIEATNILRSTMHPHVGMQIFDRCALRAGVEERLKIAAQMANIFPVDPGLTRRTQDLLEQVSEVHGVPNDIETELLSEVCEVEEDVIEQWFSAKNDRLKLHRVAINIRRCLLSSIRVKNLQKHVKPSGSGE